MIYRSWDYTDILSIAALERECFAGESWDYQMFASSFSQPGFFGELCEEEGKDGEERHLVAYGCVQCAVDTADLLNIAVAPAFRGRGIGRTMVRRLIGGARRRGMKELFLEVRPSNAHARQLYESESFRAISVRKHYYPDGEDALVMVRKLSDEKI